MSEQNKEIRLVSVFEHSASMEYHEAGKYDVTKIVKTFRPSASGYTDVPYIEVWKGENLYAEFCQHNILGVYYFDNADK